MGNCENYSKPPSWLERTFLYTFGLSGLILLIHSTSLYLNINGSERYIILAPPRPYFGRPSRPTTPRPKPMTLNIDMESHKKMMDDRVKMMRKTCQKYGDEVRYPKRVYGNHSLMWDFDNKLVYCPIYKVASGTWTTNFLRLSKFNQDLPKWQRFSKLHGASESVSRGLFPPPEKRSEQKKVLKESTKFLVVRHPFDRIISAYTGKIANPMAKPRFYRDLQKEIVADYREDQSDKSPPTFAEYIRYLLDLTDDIETPKDWKVVDCVQAYYSVCAPCDVKYDVIIKLETHDEDTEYLIRKRNLTELQEPFTMWKHNSKGLNSIGDYDYYVYEEEYKNPLNFQAEVMTKQPETSEDTLAAEMVNDEERKKMEKIQYKKSLFKQLSKKEIKHLYENYKVDFEMFGYNIDEFLSYIDK